MTPPCQSDVRLLLLRVDDKLQARDSLGDWHDAKIISVHGADPRLVLLSGAWVERARQLQLRDVAVQAACSAKQISWDGTFTRQFIKYQNSSNQMKSGCSGGPGLNAAAKVIFPARGDHRHRVGVLPTRRSRLSKRCVALPVARCPCSKNKWTYEPIEAADEPLGT